MIKTEVKKSVLKKVDKSKIERSVIENKHKPVAIKSKNKVVFKADIKETTSLIKAGREAATNAIRTSKALGLPISYIEKGAVIKELANGTKIVVKAATDNNNLPTILLKKGMIFHAKK